MVQLHPGTIPPAVPFTNPVSGLLVYGRSCESRPARPVWVVVATAWNPPRVNNAPRKLDYLNPPPESNRGKAPARVVRVLLYNIPGGVDFHNGRPYCFSKIL